MSKKTAEEKPEALRAESAQTPCFAEVAVDVPLLGAFSYGVPPALIPSLRPGHLVHVPWRQRSRSGVVLRVTDALPAGVAAKSVKFIEDILDPTPVLEADVLEMVQFIATYYRAPIGEAAKMAIPAGLRRSGTRVFALTEAGRAPNVAPAEPAHRRALDALQTVPELPGPELLGQARGLTYLALDLLVAAGLLSSRYELERPTATTKTEDWVRLIRRPMDGVQLGKNQLELLALLEGAGLVPLASLRTKVANPRASLRGLQQRGYVAFESREVIRDPMLAEPLTEPKLHELTESQSAALTAIGRSLGEQKAFKGFLLHGVTGSGKTEVYIRAIRAARAAGQGALVILPEIALTPQFCSVFRSHFGDDVAVLHSGLTAGERFDAWRRLRAGDVGIAIGARSVLFAPIPKLGIIVVDEEHDPSFKQSEAPRYNARDMALMRGKIVDCPVVLGSATPSLESYHLSLVGRLDYLPMKDRVGGALPEVEIVDMSGRNPKEKTPYGAGLVEAELVLLKRTLSTRLLQALDETMHRGEQAIILLNRRGHATFVQCVYCGTALYCPNCSVSLTYHKHSRQLRCHYCDFFQRLPNVCAACGRPDLDLLGVGTERLSDLLKKVLPGRRIERLDRDTGGGQKLRALINRFREGQIDVLVGTQMVAKGHDIHNVTLVGVVLADLGLNFPDFRAGERTFQLMTQVAGRAGRGERPGTVIIQTLMPDHPALMAAEHHSYDLFAEYEMPIRQELGYPPFRSLTVMRFEAVDAHLAEDCARAFAHSLLIRKSSQVTLLGPAASPLGRIRGRSRFQLMLKSLSRAPLREAIEAAYAELDADLKGRFADVWVLVDVDAVDML